MISSIYFIENTNHLIYIETLKKLFENDNKIKNVYHFKYKGEIYVYIDFFIDISREVFNKYVELIKSNLNYGSNIRYKYMVSKNKPEKIYNSINCNQSNKCHFIDDDD